MKGKRLTKREIKEDAFVTYAFRVVDYVKEHRSKVIMAVAAVIVVIAGASYISSSREAAEEEASRQLLAGMLQQRGGNYRGAAAAYEEVVSRYSGTDSGKLAVLYLGHARYELGQYEQALERYQEYLRKEKGDELTAAHATRGAAACMENTGRYEEAADLYESAARELDEADEAPGDLMSAARCWKLAGKPERAMEILKEVIDSYPEYRDVDRARVYLAELEYGSSG